MKNKFKSRVTLLNIISTLILQATVMLSGFIIPKLILDTFGSEVNGLVSSLSQFLNYISLVEGGITGVVMATLYKPLAEHDEEKLSSVVATAQKFFRRIGEISIFYAIGLAVFYPLIFRTEFSFGFVASLTLILSMQLLIQYMLALTYKTLLNADKKIYIVSFTQTAIRILEIILAVVAVKVFPDIHLLKFLTGAAFLIQPIVYTRYVKKHYRIKPDAAVDNTLLRNRWSGLAVNTAAFMHNSTDVTVLTIFTNLSTVSVYSVYSLMTSGMKNVINALVSSLNPLLGHAYAKKDFRDLNEKLDLYEYIIFMLISFGFGMAGLLITPFVLLYTDGLADADYSQPVFGVLMVIAEALYLLKFPHLNLAYAANKFREITRPAFIEAGLNIIISVALVPFLGLVGVAIGTLVAMIYRLAFHVYYTAKIVPGRRQMIFYRKLAIFMIAAMLGVLICLLLPAMETGVMSWLWHAVCYGAILGSVLVIISLIFFRKEVGFLRRYLKRSKRK